MCQWEKRIYVSNSAIVRPGVKCLFQIGLLSFSFTLYYFQRQAHPSPKSEQTNVLIAFAISPHDKVLHIKMRSLWTKKGTGDCVHLEVSKRAVYMNNSSVLKVDQLIVTMINSWCML